NQFSDNQFEAWQTSLGFVSAEKYLEPVFQEYDNLQSEQELDDFVDNYKDQLFIGKDEDGNYTVDYPYCSMLWLRLMNKDGVFKIGDILHSYERNYIAVSDGDINKLKIAKQNPEKFAGMQGEDNVYVEQYSNLKSDFYNDFNSKVTYHSWTNTSGEYKLTIKLECISRIITNDTYRTYTYIWVKGEKERSWGSGYKRIRSKYEIDFLIAEIKYPADLHRNPDPDAYPRSIEYVSHNILDNDSYETSSKRRYGSFVFDEYIRVVNSPGNMFELPELNDIDIEVSVGGDHWHCRKKVYGYVSWDEIYNPCPGNFPVWFINN
nr:hypothetical protein [Prolixibacteraceae bacterium]